MDRAFRANVGRDVQILYTDTDSAMIRCKRESELQFKFGPGYREWKSELPQNAEMTSYCALGPKSYSYTYENDDGVHTTMKCKGFSLKRREDISHDEMQEMVQKRKEGEITQKTIPQFNLRIEKKSRKIFNSYFFKTLSSDILKKRVLIKGKSYTMPYGFSEEMLQNVRVSNFK